MLQQSQEAYRLKLQGASHRHKAAKEFKTMLEQQSDGTTRGSDAGDALICARQAESQALAEYSHALRVFTEVTMSGKLPVEESAATLSGRATSQEVRLISVVDDDESVREAMKTLLRSVGFQVLTFASAENFLKSGLSR